jgi:hypothetical protein
MLFREQSFACTSGATGVLTKLFSPKLENWWVVYKVNPKMHTRQYDKYVEGHEDDDIYQEEIEVDQNFMVLDEAGLTELDTGDVD